MRTAGYSVRMLREGVLYVLRETAGRRVWTGYMVHAHGYLAAFDPESTPVPSETASPACEMAVRGANRSLVWIANPKDVSNLWYFFNPDPVLPDILRKLKASPEKLHHIDISAWVGSCPTTPHTCTPDALSAQVGEWAALTDPILLDALNEQIYGVMGIATAEQGYGKGQMPLYRKGSLKLTSTSPPANEIFSESNPQGVWRLTERQGPGELPEYAEVHGSRLRGIAKALGVDPANPKKLPGLVAVCDDAIGIAQEVNHWRNKGYHELIQWGDVVDPDPTGINKQSRKTRAEVASSWVRMEDEFKRRRLAVANMSFDRTESLLTPQNPIFRDELRPDQQRAVLPFPPHSFANRAEYAAYIETIKKNRAAATARVEDRAEATWAEYASQLDTDAMKESSAEYVKKAGEFEAKVHKRAPDLLAWIRSNELQEALALYDGEGRKVLAQGVKCAAQINGIVEGLGGGGEASVAQLMTWAADHTDNPLNLLWRGYLMNQEDALKSFKAAMAAAEAPGKSNAVYVQAFKDQLDKFSKFNDMMGGFLEYAAKANEAGKNVSSKIPWTIKSGAVPLFGLSPISDLISQATLASIKAGSGRVKAENKLAYALIASKLVGTGSERAVGLLSKIYMEFEAAYPLEARSPLGSHQQFSKGTFGWVGKGAIDEIVAEGKQGEFFKLRVAGAMAGVEAVLLAFKAKQLLEAKDVEASQRAALELGASALTTLSAAMEAGALMQEWIRKGVPAVPGDFAAGLERYSQIRLANFKLAGAGLSALAGAASAWMDFSDAGKAKEDNKVFLMWLLSAKGALNAVAAASGLLLGVSYTSWLLSRGAAQGAAQLAAEVMLLRARYILFAVNFWASMGVIAITTMVALLDDDEIAKWCKRSSFRKMESCKKRSDPPFDKPGEELIALHSAFKDVAG